MSKAWKMLKVFVSSTFLDLELERDRLNHVFETIEDKILKRRLTICPYDLRWRDRSVKEPVVNWCLRLVESCDYFIGILGNRYGWRPPFDINGAHNEQNISITEMEMRLALDEIPRHRRFFCFTEFESDSGENAENIAATKILKDYLIEQKEDIFICKNMEELLQHIEQHFQKIIDREYPAEQKVTVVEEQTYRDALRAIIGEKVRKFCGRKKYLKELHDFVESTEKPNYLCYNAVAGTGKSAFLAKFICERKSTKIPIIAHFMGMGRDTRHVRGIIKNLAQQLIIWNIMDGSISSDIDQLQNQVRKCLEQTTKKLILLIDGLDEVVENERHLRWLPKNLSNNIRVILTTRPVDTLDIVRSFPSVKIEELQPLSSTEIREVIQVFSQIEKISIDNEEIKILIKRAAGNPLYLKVALEEMAASGIAAGQLAMSIDKLFDQIIKRLENEFADKLQKANLPPQQVIHSFLGLISAGEKGILEKDLKEILHVGDDFVLAATKALRNFIIQRKNFLDFFHPEFELNIKMRQGKSGMRASHAKIAEYLQKKGYDYYRTIEELPYQLQWSENYEKLLALLTDFNFLSKKCIAGLLPELKDDFHFALHGEVVKLRENSEWEIAPGIRVNRHIIQLLNRTLGIDGQFLQRNPHCLFQTLWNYGYWYDVSESAKHYPLVQEICAWQKDDAKLYKLVEHWHSQYQGNCWLQSVRPLPIHLDSAILNVFTHEQPITGIDVSSDGQKIASGSYDNHLRIWDTHTSEILLLQEYEVPINDVKFSPDTSILYVANLQVDVWDTINNVKIKSIGEYGKVIVKLHLSLDGRFLAMARESDVVVWDIQKNAEIATVKGHSSTVSCLAISPDAKILVTGSYDFAMHIWCLETQQLLHQYKSEGIITGIDFHPSGKNIAIATHIYLQIWDVEKKEISYSKNLAAAPMSVCYSFDGNFIAIGTQDIQILNSTNYEKVTTLKGHESVVNSLHFIPNSNKLASGSMDKTARLWNIAHSGADVRPVGHKFVVSATKISPNGKVCISASYDQNVHVWDMETGVLLSQFSIGLVSCIAFAPDNNTIAFGMHDHTIHIWDLAGSKKLATLTGHSQSTICSVFNENGNFLASSSDDLSVRIWDWRSQKCIRELKNYEVRIVALRFEGNKIHSRSYIDEKIWDINSGECLETQSIYNTKPDTGIHDIIINDGETQINVGKEYFLFPMALEHSYSNETNIVGSSGSYTFILKLEGKK